MVAIIAELFPAINLIVGLVYVVLAFIVLFRNCKSLLNRVCFAFLISFAIWSFGIIGIKNLGTTKEVALFSENIAAIGWTSFSALFLWFTLVFTERKSVYKSRWFYYLFFVPPLVFLFLQWRMFLIVDFVTGPYGWFTVWSKETLMPIVFYVYYFINLFISLFLLGVEFFKADNINKKRQTAIIFITMFIGFFGGTFLDVMVPVMNLINIPQGAHIVMLIWAFGLMWAMVRYQFLQVTPETAADDIVNTIDDIIFLLDKDGRIIFANSAIQEKAGYKPSEIQGKPINMFFSQEDRKSDLTQEIIGPDEISNRDIIFKVKKGKGFDALLSTSIFGNKRSKKQGTVVVIRDISEVRGARQTLEKKIDELKRINKLMIGRELKMMEMKKKIKEKNNI